MIIEFLCDAMPVLCKLEKSVKNIVLNKVVKMAMLEQCLLNIEI